MASGLYPEGCIPAGSGGPVKEPFWGIWLFGIGVVLFVAVLRIDPYYLSLYWGP